MTKYCMTRDQLARHMEESFEPQFRLQDSAVSDLHDWWIANPNALKEEWKRKVRSLKQ